MAAARKLFWEHGYSRTSMREIGKACNYDPSNVYNYFASKEALLFEILMEEASELVESIKGLENDNTMSAAEQLRTLIKNHLKTVLGYRRTAKLLFESDLRVLSRSKQQKVIEVRDIHDKILQKILKRGVESGEFNVKDIEVTVYNITAMIIRVRMWYSPRGRLTVDEIGDLIFDTVYNGLHAG